MDDAKEALFTAKIKKTIAENDVLLQRLIKENETPKIDEEMDFEELIASAKRVVERRTSGRLLL